MIEELEKETNMTYTENGATTFATTASDCLDLFSTIGAIRTSKNDEIIKRFVRAYTENPDYALKILFFARDIRGGLGERRVFRVILKWLAENAPEVVRKSVEFIAEYGRYDDILALLGTKSEKFAIELIKNQLKEDMKNANSGDVSLLAKWLPSVNASNSQTVKDANVIIRALGVNAAQYRKTLSALRAKIKIIENNLRQKDYTFDYSAQPSKAMLKYRKAFVRNDEERYVKYLEDVQKGEKKMNATTLCPYEVVRAALDDSNGRCEFNELKKMTAQEIASLNVTWENLPDYGTKENALAVIDTSGSMYYYANALPATVALSLGLYFAERNEGAFKNYVMEFSDKPTLIKLKGKTFVEKLRYLLTFNKVASTNVEVVFDTILRAAVKNKVSQSELPKKIVIISDMEFNQCVEDADSTNYEKAREKFEKAGYSLPQVVFWNVASRVLQQPVTKDEKGTILVSGATPKIFEMIAGGCDYDPYQFMMEVINDERYKKIRV